MRVEHEVLEFVDAVMKESSSMDLVSRPVWCLSESEPYSKTLHYNEREAFLAT